LFPEHLHLDETLRLNGIDAGDLNIQIIDGLEKSHKVLMIMARCFQPDMKSDLILFLDDVVHLQLQGLESIAIFADSQRLRDGLPLPVNKGTLMMMAADIDSNKNICLVQDYVSLLSSGSCSVRMSKLVNTGFPSPGSQRASFAFIADEQEERTVALDHCPKLKFVLILNASYSTVELLVNHLLFSVSPYRDSIIRIKIPVSRVALTH
jgi:hypothetical protein